MGMNTDRLHKAVPRTRNLSLWLPLWLSLVTAMPAQVVAQLAAQVAAQAPIAAPADNAPRPTAPLNSDRIRAAFGSYGVDVLRQDAERRVSNLYSETAGSRICRTLAISQFSNPVPEPLSNAHRRILEGGSIGITLREEGWRISKTPLFTGQIPNGIGFEKIARLSRQDGRELALVMYDLSVERAGLEYRYVTITEIYHPDYLSYDEVTSIYGSPPARADDEARISSLLSKARDLINQPELAQPETP